MPDDPVPTSADVLAAEVWRLARPGGGVVHLAGEVLDAGKVGPVDRGQTAGGAQQEVGAVRAHRSRCAPPTFRSARRRRRRSPRSRTRSDGPDRIARRRARGRPESRAVRRNARSRSTPAAGRRRMSRSSRRFRRRTAPRDTGSSTRCRRRRRRRRSRAPSSLPPAARCTAYSPAKPAPITITSYRPAVTTPPRRRPRPSHDARPTRGVRGRRSAGGKSGIVRKPWKSPRKSRCTTCTPSERNRSA